MLIVQPEAGLPAHDVYAYFYPNLLHRSGKPYDVTIWFMVEGETVYLVTANRKRQWPRNVVAQPTVLLRIGNEIIGGQVEEITDPTTIEHVTDLMAAKYWYTWPYVWLARLLGWRVPSAAFRVRPDDGKTLLRFGRQSI